jgi:DnaJ-class molecular chaperone
MKREWLKERVPEIRCAACNGTGFLKVKQPVEPGRRIYPAPCKECAGKGRLTRNEIGGNRLAATKIRAN